MRERRRRDAPNGEIGIGVEIGGARGAIGIGIVGDCGVGSSVPASVPTASESNGIASLMTPSLVYKPILSYFFISPISILETLSSNFSTGVIFSLVK